MIQNWTAGVVEPRVIDWDAELREGEPGFLAESAGVIARRLGVTRQAVSQQAHKRGLRGQRITTTEALREHAIRLQREKDWSHRDIAEVVGVARSTVAMWFAKEAASCVA